MIQNRIKDIRAELFEDSNVKFANAVGEKNNTTSNWINPERKIGLDVINKILQAIPNLDANWLLTGEGSMYKDNSNVEVEHMEGDVPSNFKLLPLMNMDIAGGSTNQEVDTAEYVMKYIPFVDARDGDIACPVTNNSMSPVYPPGTIVQIRRVEMWREYIEYGQVYVVDLKDGRRLIKQVRKSDSKNMFTLVSFNKEYDENDVSVDMIYSVWLVIAKYEKLVM